MDRTHVVADFFVQPSAGIAQDLTGDFARHQRCGRVRRTHQTLRRRQCRQRADGGVQAGVRRPVAQRTMMFADKVSRIAALGMRPASLLRNAVLAVTGRRALARALTDR